MSEMMAYCGLLCSECPTYKATVASRLGAAPPAVKADYCGRLRPRVEVEHINIA